jgi:hypothetical protein
MTESLSLYNIFTALRKHFLWYLGICIAIPVLTYLGSLLLDNLYKSSVVVFPTNNFLNDRNYYYKENIQSLYSQYGGDEEIDQITEIGSAEHSLIKIADSLALYTFYNINEPTKEKTLFKTAKKLKKRVSFLRTKNNALEISVWDKDGTTAKKILQLLLREINVQYALLQKQRNSRELQLVENKIKVIKDEIIKSQLPTNYSTEINTISKQAIIQQLTEVEKLRVSILASPTAETAFYEATDIYTSLDVDKPNRLLLVGFSILAAIIIATLFVTVQYARKNK